MRDCAVIFLHGDRLTERNGTLGATETYRNWTSEQLQAEAETWSLLAKAPYLMLARPGTYGSSGQHTHRRQRREVALVDAAISAIKRKHGFERLILVGQSGGGLLVGAMLSRREDIVCAVISSGLVSVQRRNLDLRQDDPTGLSDVYDPADHVPEISRKTGVHVIVLTDPTDRNVTASSQADYVARLKAHGVSVQHVAAPGRGPNNHHLDKEGIAAAIDWLNGMTGDALARKYGTAL